MNKPISEMNAKELGEKELELAACEAAFLVIDMRHLKSKGAAFAKAYGFGTLHGIEAIHRFLVEQHHWSLADVRALSNGDLIFLIDGHKLVMPWPRKPRRLPFERSTPAATD